MAGVARCGGGGRGFLREWKRVFLNCRPTSDGDGSSAGDVYPHHLPSSLSSQRQTGMDIPNPHRLLNSPSSQRLRESWASLAITAQLALRLSTTTMQHRPRSNAYLSPCTHYISPACTPGASNIPHLHLAAAHPEGFIQLSSRASHRGQPRVVSCRVVSSRLSSALTTQTDQAGRQTDRTSWLSIPPSICGTPCVTPGLSVVGRGG